MFQVAIFMGKALVEGRPAKRMGAARAEAQIEKLVPQPQEAMAWGFLIWNDGADQIVDESISEPARYPSDTGSTRTVAPSRSSTTSSACGSRARGRTCIESPSSRRPRR